MIRFVSGSRSTPLLQSTKTEVLALVDATPATADRAGAALRACGDAAIVEIAFDGSAVGTVQQLLVGSDEGATQVAEGDAGSGDQSQRHQVDARIVLQRRFQAGAVVGDSAARGHGFQQVGQGAADDFAVVVHLAGLVTHRLAVALLPDAIRRQSVGADDARVGLDVGTGDRVAHEPAELEAEVVAHEQLSEDVAGRFVDGATFVAGQVLAGRLDGDDAVAVLVPAHAQVEEDVLHQTGTDAGTDADVDLPVLRVEVGVVAHARVVHEDLERLVLRLHAQLFHPDQLGVQGDVGHHRRELVLLLADVEVVGAVRLGLDLHPLAILANQHDQAMVLEHRRVGQVIDVVVDHLLSHGHLGVGNAQQGLGRDAVQTDLGAIADHRKVELRLVVEHFAGAGLDQHHEELAGLADGQLDLVDRVEAPFVLGQNQLGLGVAGLERAGQVAGELLQVLAQRAGQLGGVLLGGGDGFVFADHLAQHLAGREDLDGRVDREDVALVVHVNADAAVANAQLATALEGDVLLEVDAMTPAELLAGAVVEFDALEVERFVEGAGAEHGHSVGAGVTLEGGAAEDGLLGGSQVTNVAGAVVLQFQIGNGGDQAVDGLAESAGGKPRDDLAALRRGRAEHVMQLVFDDFHSDTS